jgi:hypothetical protein
VFFQKNNACPNAKQVTEILDQYGFDTIDTQEIGKYHYIVNGVKKL